MFCSHAVCSLRPVYVCAVQLHACGGEDDQRHCGQPLSAHRRPLQPLLWHLPLQIHGELIMVFKPFVAMETANVT